MLQSNLLNTATKGKCVHITQVSMLQSNLLNTDTKGYSVHITQVSMLQSNLLNTATKRTECPHKTGVYVTVNPP